MERTENPIQVLANLFGSLARIFSDPRVQETGQHFFDALGEATDRELPSLAVRGTVELGTGKAADNGH